MRRFTAKTVFFGLVRACRLAIWPTRRSPFAVKPTMEGVVRAPSWFGMTCGAPPSITATHELVVPRSMPMTLPTLDLSALLRLSPGVWRGDALLQRHWPEALVYRFR